jgi:uncharacterized membrane protein
MKKAMWIISCISVVGTAFMLPFMPESVPMHYDTAGNVDRWGSKYENFIFPIIIIAMSLFWTLLIFAFEKKAGKTSDEKERASALSNAKFLGAVGMAMAGMFTIIQGFILYGSYEEAISAATHSVVDIGQISCILLGVLLSCWEISCQKRETTVLPEFVFRGACTMTTHGERRIVLVAMQW